MRLQWALIYLISFITQVLCIPIGRVFTFRLDGNNYHNDPSIMPFSFKQPAFKSTVNTQRDPESSLARFNSAKRFFQDIRPPRIINPMSLRLE